MSDWINTKDRLPAFDQLVLLCIITTNDYGQFGSVKIGTGRLDRIDKHGEYFNWAGGGAYSYNCKNSSTDTVTHWMPMPKPPEEYKYE